MTLCLTSAGPSGAVGTKSAPLGPSEDLGAPQKGFSGQNRALLRPPGAQKGPDIRSKCVLTMSLTQAGQWGAVGTKSGPHGPPRTSGAPKRAFWSQNEPFWGPERSFKGPKGMIWMRPTQAHCVEVFLMQFGPSRLFPGLRGGQKGPQK